MVTKDKQKSIQPSPNASIPSPPFQPEMSGGRGRGAQREGDKKVQQITFLHSEGRYNHGDSAGAAVLMNTATYWFPFVFSSSPLSPASSVSYFRLDFVLDTLTHLFLFVLVLSFLSSFSGILLFSSSKFF